VTAPEKPLTSFTVKTSATPLPGCRVIVGVARERVKVAEEATVKLCETLGAAE
jgi:hypothetical protein